jgi:hypothetical protein
MSQKQEIVPAPDMQDIKHLFYELQDRDRNGMVIASLDSLINIAKSWASATTGQNPVVSDGVAGGVIILTYSLAAATTLVITKLKVACNVEAYIALGVGALATPPTDYDLYYLNGKQTWYEFLDSKGPVMVIYNSTAAAVNVNVYAPGGAIFGIADNNPVGGGTIFGATLGGFTF